MYYIISLKHTHKQDKYITLWRENNSGYCYTRYQSGVYNEIKEGYHNGEGDSLPILMGELEGLFIDSDIVIDNKNRKCIPNCKLVWDMLNLKMTRRGLVVNRS